MGIKKARVRRRRSIRAFLQANSKDWNYTVILGIDREKQKRELFLDKAIEDYEVDFLKQKRNSKSESDDINACDFDEFDDDF
ncbi:hypothetical protein SY111_17340 [Ligilactobacillus agilis]|uniref:Uncharacterized protein n=1 Tax=Ligilactobacillus agilis TaxID=1601 RepID=A0A6F9XVF1_9LACO|nr:hypothetical protein [Ligilactobacillus agilis]GET09110.1 hypothetical protein SY111_17340 [Ligilactobacillus agilis]